MKNLFSKLFDNLKKKLNIILPIITLLCFAGFVGSLFFPNKVLDTNKVNMQESDEDFYIALKEADESIKVCYMMETEARPLQGVQVGISKNGKQLAGASLQYSVFVQNANSEDDEENEDVWTEVSENIYDLGSQAYDFQYAYLPFTNSKQCQGKVLIIFAYAPGNYGKSEDYVSLRFNHTTVDKHASSIVRNSKEEEAGGELMVSCIYSHNTYPFLYDFRILSFVFMAVSMTLQFGNRLPKRKSEEGGTVHE